jgi:undecaprenyl diphosphate synthase
MPYLMKRGCQVRISGDLSRIREKTRKVCLEAIEESKDNKNFVINVCLNYGGRDDIVKAARALALEAKEGKINPEDINEEVFASHLYTAGLPDIDLMIRTSGEQRLSNYLLYQNAYAEFVFTPVKWPDFHRQEVIDCLEEYQNRNRRFGGLINE